MPAQKSHTPLAWFFDRNPELKTKLDAYLATVTEEEKKRNLETVDRFMRGEITWAEVKGVPQRLLKFLATAAYQSFKSGDLKRAEILFKGLAVLDHNNWYYRAGLGSVYQKQHNLEQAVQEYDIALQLNPAEITSLVNRGQCLLGLGDEEAALKDFQCVQKLPVPPENPWRQRADLLVQMIQNKRVG